VYHRQRANGKCLEPYGTHATHAACLGQPRAATTSTNRQPQVSHKKKQIWRQRMTLAKTARWLEGFKRNVIEPDGVLDRSDILHHPSNPFAMKSQPSQHTFQENPINTIICLGKIQLVGSKVPALLIPLSDVMQTFKSY
jgi:hypothetical protein